MYNITISLGEGKQFLVTIDPEKLILIAAAVAVVIALMVFMRIARKKQDKEESQTTDSIPATQLDDLSAGTVSIVNLHSQ